MRPYTDSGPGYTENKNDGSGLGMTLISSIGVQIDGEVEIKHENGFFYRIVFPVKE